MPRILIAAAGALAALLVPAIAAGDSSPRLSEMRASHAPILQQVELPGTTLRQFGNGPRDLARNSVIAQSAGSDSAPRSGGTLVRTDDDELEQGDDAGPSGVVGHQDEEDVDDVDDGDVEDVDDGEVDDVDDGDVEDLDDGEVDDVDDGDVEDVDNEDVNDNEDGED